MLVRLCFDNLASLKWCYTFLKPHVIYWVSCNARHTVRKWIYIGHKLPRTFDSSLSIYDINAYKKCLEKLIWTKKKNLVPQGGTEPMYHTKLVHFCMFIVQNSSKKFTFLQIPHEISKFLIYWDCPHYVWMRKEIKFYIDLVYFHSDFAIQFMNKSVFAENIFKGNIVFRVFKIRRCRCSKSR